jgi:enterochelin esterase family protein
VPRLDWESGDRSPLLLEFRKRVAEGQFAAVTEFWTSIEKSGSPIVEPIAGSQESVLVTFVWKGKPETKNVFLLWPRLSYARPDDYFFSHLPGADVWFKTLKVQRGMRIHYQLSPDDPLGQRPEGRWSRRAQADPLNPKRDNPDRSVPPEHVRSLLELPGALPQPWYAKRLGVPRYSQIEKEISSQVLKSVRKIFVYTPPGFSAQHQPYPSIYLTDGEDPDGLVFATWTFENLLAEGRIPPTVVIRIVNADQETRNRELACNTPFTNYLNDELVPFVRNSFNTSSEPSKTAIGGYSLGGLAASYAGLRHPETFGLILSQSGAYWFEPTHQDYAEPNWLARQFAERHKLPLRFYMDAGTNELDMTGRGGGILVPNRQLRDVLRAKGYEVRYQEFAGDHDYINWRGTLADGLIALLGGQTKLGLLPTSKAE